MSLQYRNNTLSYKVTQDNIFNFKAKISFFKLAHLLNKGYIK